MINYVTMGSTGPGSWQGTAGPGDSHRKRPVARRTGPGDRDEVCGEGTLLESLIGTSQGPGSCIHSGLRGNLHETETVPRPQGERI